jgi:exosortase/archaeosortase family protein
LGGRAPAKSYRFIRLWRTRASLNPASSIQYPESNSSFLKKPIFRFLLVLGLLIVLGGLIRYLYHTIPGGVSFVSHSWIIDTFYRLLIGPVDFLLLLTGIPHKILYSRDVAQYIIHLEQPNVSLMLWIPCLGISIMYIYTALIIAYPNTLKNKLVYILFGNLAIQLLNILRLYGLSLLIAHTNTTQTQSVRLPWLVVNHETIFNYGVIFLVFLMFVVYARRSKFQSN